MRVIFHVAVRSEGHMRSALCGFCMCVTGFHATTTTGMVREVNNNSFDCSSLGFVDSHGKGTIKGKWLMCMNFSNGRKHVLGAQGEAFD